MSTYEVFNTRTGLTVASYPTVDQCLIYIEWVKTTVSDYEVYGGELDYLWLDYALVQPIDINAMLDEEERMECLHGLSNHCIDEGV